MKTKFQGFPGLKKLVFKDFPGYIPFSNTGCMRSKKCTYQISYRCNCITVNKPKCSTCSCINTCIDPRGGKMHTSVTMYYNEFLIYFAILKLEIKISRTTALEFQDFPGFSRTYAFFQDFPGLEISTIKFHDFPGSVRTLEIHQIPFAYLTEVFTKPYVLDQFVRMILKTCCQPVHMVNISCVALLCLR